MNPIIDEAVAQGEEQRRLEAENIQAVFDRDVTGRLKPVLDDAPGWMREILEYSPTALSVVQKVAKTPYYADVAISRCCAEIHAAVESAKGVQSGLDAYQKIGPQDLLLRDGRVDINAASKLFFWIRGLLIPARGRRRVMEQAVRCIEARLKYLMEAETYGSSAKPVPIASDAVVLVPLKKPHAAAINVETKFDARNLHHKHI
jgi:hypothetical protein